MSLIMERDAENVLWFTFNTYERYEYYLLALSDSFILLKLGLRIQPAE